MIGAWCSAIAARMRTMWNVCERNFGSEAGPQLFCALTQVAEHSRGFAQPTAGGSHLPGIATGLVVAVSAAAWCAPALRAPVRPAPSTRPHPLRAVRSAL